MEALTWLTQGNGHTCKHACVESQVCNVMTLDTAEKKSFSLKISSVNVSKSAVFYGFGHIC